MPRSKPPCCLTAALSSNQGQDRAPSSAHRPGMAGFRKVILAF
jgi:hypothetical protein